MAEKMKCLICGYKTVRCGIIQHIKHSHPDDYNTQPIENLVTSLGIETKEERQARKLKRLMK